MTLPVSHARLVPLEGALNFRDIGGYTTSEGRTTRWGRVYRAGLISRLTDADLATLVSRRILTIIDLREPEEAAIAPDRLPPGAECITCPTGHNSLSDWAHMLTTASSGVPFMRALYSDTHGLATRFKPFFKALLELPEDRSILLHCMAGKDRTGIGIALLLVALGVSRDTIMEDYLLTNQYRLSTLNADIQAAVANLRLTEQVSTDLVTARPEYMQALFESLDNHHGSSEQFLAQAIGLTTEKTALLREKFTE